MSDQIQRPGHITQRQWQVCRMKAEGLTLKEIARQLQISHRTVEDHLLNAYRAFGVDNVFGLIGKLTEQGLPCPCCGRTAA